VPFTLDVLENTEEKDTDNTETKHNPEKAYNAKYSKQSYPDLVAFYDTRSGNEEGLFYNTPEPTQDTTTSCTS